MGREAAPEKSPEAAGCVIATRQQRADDELAKLITHRHLESAFALEPRHETWLDARKRYEPQYVDKQRVRTPPYVKFPYVFRTVNTQLEQLMTSSEANGTFVRARSLTPEHGSVGEAVTQALDNNFRAKASDYSFTNREGVERTGRHGLLYGNGWCHCQWFDYGDDWGVRYTPIDPFDVYPDWRANRWIVIRRRISMAHLRDMVYGDWSAEIEEPVGVDADGQPIVNRRPRDGGRAIRAWKKLLKQVKQGYKDGAQKHPLYYDGREKQITLNRVSAIDGDSNAEQFDSRKDPFNAEVTILEYFETHHSGIRATIAPGFQRGDDPMMFLKEQNPYGVCPIVPFVPFPIDNELFGLGTSEIVGHLAEVMDTGLRDSIRIVNKAANAPMLHRRSLRLRRDFIRHPAGKAIGVNDPASDIRYLELPSSAAAAFQFAKMIGQQAADMGTGESEQRRGNASGANSATAAAIAEVGSNMVDRMLFRRWRVFVEQLAHVTLKIMRVHVTDEKAIPILGRDAPDFLKLRPEYLENAFAVEYGGSATAMNRQQATAEWLNFGAAFGPTGVVDMPALARKIARLMGEPNPDEILAVKEAARPLSPAQEHVQLDSAQELKVSPLDNHQQHLMEHIPEYQRRAAAMDPTAPTLLAHIQQTVMAVQIMQQQAAAAGQTDQFGQGTGPGEPMTQAGTASNVDEMRQQGNFNAGGAAPGGVVPNRQTGQMVNGGMLQ